MSDDNSNDVVMVESTEEDSNSSKDSETRPLMQLFQRLISNDNKQNTVLTNAQIISILHKEFEIDITTLHELEVDIYLNIVKKFLKDWPLWDEFDRGVNWLRKQKAFTSIKQTLESKYVNLKEYLRVQLEATKPIAREAVQKLFNENSKKMEKVDTSDIVLEVYCTRRQLAELMYCQPNPDFENNIFHVLDNIPTAISLNNIPPKAILNWWGINVSIDLKVLSLSWSTVHQTKHTLVNKNNGPRDLKQILNQNIQIKDVKRSTDYFVKKELILSIFESLLKIKELGKDSQMYLFFESLHNMIESDLESFHSDIAVPATYRKYSSKYPYFRKLYKEPKSVPSKSSTNLYDLYIEETLTPMHILHIGRVLNGIVSLPSNYTWFSIACGECKVKFMGMDFYTRLKDHFETYHLNEPNWTCTNCEESFPMIQLAENKWHHDCKG